METVEEHPSLDIANVVKPNVIDEQSVAELTVCQQSNGVDCDMQAEGELSEANDVQPDLEVKAKPNIMEVESATPEDVSVPSSGEPDAASEAEPEMPVDSEGVAPDEPDSNITINAEEVQHENEMAHVEEIQHEVVTETIIEAEKEICIEDGIVTETIVEMESSISTVHFETEVLVEENDADVGEKLMADSQEADHTNNILNELGPNIELSEVLRSSDISENVENNNSAVKQEIFNKEELLDILEGNDNMEQAVDKVTETSPHVSDKIKEAEIAMQQLSRLKTNGRRKGDQRTSKNKREKTKSPLKDGARASYSRNSEKEKRQTKPDEKAQESQLDNKQSENQADCTEQQSQHDKDQVSQTGEAQVDKQQTLGKDQQTPHPASIVKTLVMDWEDDPTDNNDVNDTIQEGENFIKELEELRNNQESVISKDVSLETTVTDTSTNESMTKLIKTEEECPTRRISRVIKKKVIFDPDNPDTFTKGKSSKTKETHATKEQTPGRKGKSDQTVQRSKSKSPISKLQWKKPSAKNSKQCKRLSEVDKLLMDEGAVNMIYQLTPEAPKGKKNVRTKAEFIKKIQSSTPDSKEVMKFRERKKESKYDEGEVRKLLVGKHRNSLSSSVKSPAVSEDFETHSADDSIIYRRHSSSSYSSSCMSPRRLSDVEAGSTQQQNATRLSQQPVAELEPAPKETVNEEIVYQTESPKPITSEMINKNDCLSIKEKLNSKLSIALNKRKRESSKNEKPAKQKKIIKPEESTQCLVKEDEKLNLFKFISVTFDQRLALVGIKKTGIKICVEILKELEEALNYIDSRDDISVTLLESQCGTLCSSLDLSLLLDDNREIRVNHAYELAESVRLVLQSLMRHRKLVVCGAWGACAGVALALVALSDVPLASERASFWLAAAAAPALPGAAALTARCRPLPQALVNDLVIFGRRLSASEALQGGLVSRVLWPDRFDEQVLNIAKDIAAQPLQTILLKKRLLSLSGNSEAELTFLASLELERDLLVEYWTSVEGQELLRATLDAA